MPTPRLTDEELRAIYELVLSSGGVLGAAETAGVARSTMDSRWQRAKIWAKKQGLEVPPRTSPILPSEPRDAPEKPFVVEEIPDELPTADELIRRREEQFSRKARAKDARHLLPVRVTVDGPIGLAFVGDPHIDDDGTDMPLLRRHLDIINKNEALLPLGIGDYANNWVGRLARLYGQQSVTAAEAWVLVEWLVQQVRWLALVSGNHDAWSGDGDPIKWMARAARVQYEAHGARLGLTLPSGRVIRVNARHDFRGKSQWNTAHGIGKAAQLGWRDHVLTAGHTHVSGIQIVRDPMSGLISHCIRIGSYKTYDRYADELGLPNQTFTTCPVVVIRPQFDDDDNRLLTTFLEPETAAEFLSWLRKRKSERAA